MLQIFIKEKLIQNTHTHTHISVLMFESCELAKLQVFVLF